MTEGGTERLVLVYHLRCVDPEPGRGEGDAPEVATDVPTQPFDLFESLRQELRRANKARESGADRLEVSLNCLVNVIRFLEWDTEVRDKALTLPLHDLAHAVRDCRLGVNSRLFKREKKHIGPPINTAFDGLKGICAAAFELLVHAGATNKDASEFVEKELSHLGLVLRTGKAISATRVCRWRWDIGVAASTTTADVFRGAVALVTASAESNGIEETKKTVSEMLAALVGRGFL